MRGQTDSDNASPGAAATMRELLIRAIDLGASDIHLFPGYRPLARVHGELQPLRDDAPSPEVVRAMILSICPDRAGQRFQLGSDVDFSMSIEHHGAAHRFRVNAYLSQGKPGTVLRLIPSEIPSPEWAGLPANLIERITNLRNGLVLVTGVTGSGKSTTLAILVDLLNAQGSYRIITIEEPIEFVFPVRPSSMVTQREVGIDVPSFHEGLRSGLRQDPDIILVGEIRDSETAQLALSAAETGHLVFSTMHARDAKGAITRLADLFPRDSQDDVRSQLSFALRYVVSQHLLPGVNSEERRVLALEVLFNSFGVASAVRQGKLQSLDSAIQTGRRDGMLPLDACLSQLLTSGRISMEVAKRYATDPDNIMLL